LKEPRDAEVYRGNAETHGDGRAEKEGAAENRSTTKTPSQSHPVKGAIRQGGGRKKGKDQIRRKV